MSNVAAPGSATAAPSNPGETATGVAAAEQTTTPQYTTIGGRPYTVEELQEALETKGALGSRLNELSAKEAAIAKFKDKSKLAEVLREFGHDPDDFATERLLQLQAEEQMDPRDRELSQYKAKVEAYEREQAERQRQAEEAKGQEIQNRRNSLMEQSIVGAAHKHGLPVSARALEEVMNLVEKAADNGLDLEINDAVQMVKQDMTRDLLGHVKDLSPEGLLNLLPRETQKALLKVLTDRALAPGQRAPDARKPGTQPVNHKPDYLKRMLDF